MNHMLCKSTAQEDLSMLSSTGSQQDPALIKKIFFLLCTFWFQNNCLFIVKSYWECMLCSLKCSWNVCNVLECWAYRIRIILSMHQLSMQSQKHACLRDLLIIHVERSAYNKLCIKAHKHSWLMIQKQRLSSKFKWNLSFYGGMLPQHRKKVAMFGWNVFVCVQKKKREEW